MHLTLRFVPQALLLAGALLAPCRTFAQAPAAAPRSTFASRAELEAEAARAQQGGRPLEAAQLRHRLAEGDFREGDRILISRRAGGRTDTLVVRTGGILQLPSMDDLSLTGVLRSELAARVAAHLGRYVRDTAVRVVPLVRLGVMGAVRAPGFYYVPADVPLSDILMIAGGPDGRADLGRVTVRRDDAVVVERRQMRTAISDGLSADRLHLQAGDQISVGDKRRFPWQVVTSTALAASGVVIALVSRNRGGRASPSCP